MQQNVKEYLSRLASWITFHSLLLRLPAYQRQETTNTIPDSPFTGPKRNPRTMPTALPDTYWNEVDLTPTANDTRANWLGGR